MDTEEPSNNPSSFITDTPTNNIVPLNVKNISFYLLQVNLNVTTLSLYLLSNKITPNDMELTITISSSPSGSGSNTSSPRKLQRTPSSSSSYTAKKKKSINKDNNTEISLFYVEDSSFSKKRIIVSRIEIGKYNNYNTEYNANKVNLGNNYDSQKKYETDLSKIFEEENPKYSIKSYKVQEITECTDEFKFNLTLNNALDLKNDSEITLSFIINMMNGFMAYSTTIIPAMLTNATCNLSSKYNNIIPCQSEKETRNVNFSLVDYLIYDANELIMIYADDNFTFPLYCYEQPPTAAILIITSIFLFVLIVVIAIIFLINRKGKGGKGYDVPNNESNNILRLSNLSK